MAKNKSFGGEDIEFGGPANSKASKTLMKDKIAVTFGEELFSVGSSGNYCHFRIGPFSYETTQMVGETTEAAWARAWAEVNKQATSVYLAKRNGFFERLEALKK